MQKIVLATGNQGKIKEFKFLLKQFPLELLTSADFKQIPKVIEDGETFCENALKKAVQVAAYTGYPAIADDSGLEVNALNGAPGVYSARYAGEEATDADNNKKLLQALCEVPAEKRTARFVSVIALAFPDGSTYYETGVCAGHITFALNGQGGFGYDPLFYVPEVKKTYAEMSDEEKNSCSHRAKALKKMVNLIENLFFYA